MVTSFLPSFRRHAKRRREREKKYLSWEKKRESESEWVGRVGKWVLGPRAVRATTTTRGPRVHIRVNLSICEPLAGVCVCTLTFLSFPGSKELAGRHFTRGGGGPKSFLYRPLLSSPSLEIPQFLWKVSSVVPRGRVVGAQYYGKGGEGGGEEAYIYIRYRSFPSYPFLPSTSRSRNLTIPLAL